MAVMVGARCTEFEEMGAVSRGAVMVGGRRCEMEGIGGGCAV